mgnify:CR=1 FL=1
MKGVTPQPKPYAGRSVTLRLTLLYAAGSALVLLALGLSVGSLVDRHFAEMDAELLAGKLELVQQALVDPDPATLRARLDAALVGHHGLAVAVWDAHGRELYAHDIAAFPPELRHPGERPQADASKWADADGRLFRGRAARFAGAGTGAVPGPIVAAVATDLAMHQHFMHAFERTLWSLIALAAAVSGVLGFAAARRGLAPLRDISRDAAQITADRLDRRLPAAALPEELAEVAHTLNAMFERLEASFRRLSDFSSDLAHELRTPVSNLLTQTQVMLSKARTVEEYQDVLASNAEEFERLSRTIADMLFLAKAENDLVVPNQEPVDLRAEADGLIEFYEALADENGVRLSADGAATVSGDRLMLRRAIGNLLSNALRHTPRGGLVAVSLDVADGVATVAIANTGTTIPPEHLPRLFDRFFRADPSRQRDSEGAGLGLAITRSIMCAHGGNATVRSENGTTVFELRLPA